MKKLIKTIDEIVDAIMAHGVDAYLACKYHAVLEHEVCAGGYKGEEFERAKMQVATKVAKVRRDSLRRAS